MKRKRIRRLLDGPIHARIKELREKRGLTQEQLAELVGIDKTAVSHWENRFSRPDLRNITAVAKALGVSVVELIRGEDKAA